jgi:hypothetical protein
VSDDYEVVWDGTSDRKGTCPSLVSPLYSGSTLTHVTPDRWDDGEIVRVESAIGVKGRTTGLTRSQAQRARRQRERRERTRR